MSERDTNTVGKIYDRGLGEDGIDVSEVHNSIANDEIIFATLFNSAWLFVFST